LSTVLKVCCIAIDLAAPASTVVEVPHASLVRTVALLLLVVHALDVLVAFKFVKRFDGPLGVGVALTLLFGFLHWDTAGAAARARDGLIRRRRHCPRRRYDGVGRISGTEWDRISGTCRAHLCLSLGIAIEGSRSST
jgi:hypothetical protein